MDHNAMVFFVPILVSLGAFFMIWGIRYLENKENMALIERGMEPRAKRRPDPTRTLRNGMMFVGAGLGLLLSITTVKTFNLEDNDATAVYFALIAIFGGLGMLGAYMYERRNPPTE